MSGPAFELKGVNKTYYVWRALRRTPQVGVRDLSLVVPRGIVFGLLGLNGAGKTTAMRLLVGLLRPDAGEVAVLGGPVTDPAVRARIGFLPELPYLPPQLSARGLLRAYGRMNGLSGRRLDERVSRSMELAGLDGRRSDPLRFFSKGMRQRVAMAQVLLHEPEVVFVDEPMSGLDPRGIWEMRQLLLDLKTAGMTVCLNSHQISEVERLCDRVGVMARGRLVREAAVGELLSLAGTRRYRLTLLVPAGPSAEGGKYAIEDLEVAEADLEETLAARRKAGARLLQIVARQGSLEEALLKTIDEAVGDAPGRAA